MGRSAILILTLITAGFSWQARADSIFFALDNPIQTANPGDVVQFSAEIASDYFIFLNSDTFTYSGPGAVDDGGLYVNFPQLFSPGDDWDGELFTYTLPLDLPSGTYLGSFSLYGGNTLDSNDLLGSQNFSVTTVNTSSTPEPASIALAGAGLLTLGAMRRRWRGKRRGDGRVRHRV